MVHQNRANSHRVRNGFTLLELLIVLVIAAIVMMIAVPNIDYVGMRVASSGRQVSMALLTAQRLALLRQYSVVVAFDTANRQLRIHQDTNDDGIIGPGEIVNYLKLEDGVVFGRGAAPAYTIGGNPVTFTKREAGLPSLTFSRSGSAGEAGGFYISSLRSTTTGMYRKEVRAFEVNRGTGRSLMYAYTGSQWIRSF